MIYDNVIEIIRIKKMRPNEREQKLLKSYENTVHLY